MAVSIMEIADSLSSKQKKQFLELTDKVNLLDPKSYSHSDLSKYKDLLISIDDLYDGKIDYIKDALFFVLAFDKIGSRTEKLIKEIVQ